MPISNTQYPRVLRPSLDSDLALYPVVAVVGARQVGKSTMCRQVADSRGLIYRTLDDRDVLVAAREDPEGFLADLGDAGAFIDEVQRAPELFLAIKAIVDREQQPGRYLLSGSSQPRISSGIGDSLLGRARYRTLRPLSLSELRFDEEHRGWTFLFENEDGSVHTELERRADESGALDWKEVARTGGFPRAVAAPSEYQQQVLDDYVRVFASRDVRDVVAVDSSGRFEQFLRLLCALTGQELNVQGMSRDLGIPVSTLRRWIDALLRSYLIELVQPYSRNASQRVIKAPKLFVTDVGLAIAASRVTDLTGFHLENLVATDLAIWKDNSPGRDVYHWRLSGGQEVDFILEQNTTLLPIEIKSASAVSASDARHLETFRERHPGTPRGLLISCDPNIRTIRPGILAAPWWAVL